MFDALRSFIGRKTKDENYGVEVSTADVDNEIDVDTEPEPFDGKGGWTEPDGAVCEEHSPE